jgi:3,4-dihydroxy 2-butanone 4-phosphate synthase/GTP cyclohydrolase II
MTKLISEGLIFMDKFNAIDEVITDISKGKICIVVDDKDRENEGDFIMAAEKVTPKAINFIAKYGRGLICAGLEKGRLKELELPDMVTDNTALKGTAFSVSVDAKKNTTTGISAHDRATTIKTIISKKTKPKDLSRPGHIFPIRANKGGVLRRSGHTEASVDLARLAGLYPAGVLCEIMNDDGTMARVPQLLKIAKKHKIKIGTIADLIAFRRETEKLIKKRVSTNLPTKFGKFKLTAYTTEIDNLVHIALFMGLENKSIKKTPVLVRVHDQCLTGDTFHSQRCDCGEQMTEALKKIAREGKGIFLYMRQEGRGIGLINKLKAYALQDKGLDTVEANMKLGFKADLRDYGIGAQILSDLGIRKIKLLTNNPKKIIGLKGYGLEVVQRLPLMIKPNKHNRKYLKIKKKKMGHMF